MWLLILAVFAVSTALPSAVVPARADQADDAEDWNFTRDDYAALIKSGGKLRFEADSEWLPKELRVNLKSVLNYALDPTLAPSSTDGINRDDFYHGHIGCTERGTFYPVIRQAELDAGQVYKNHGFASDMPDSGVELTGKQLQEYISAIQEAELIYGKALAQIIADPKLCPQVFGLYHTYEYAQPADGSTLRRSDERRNLMSWLGWKTPMGYTPPGNPDSAEGWMLDHFNILQISFLIDRHGVIHVTQGTVPHLSRVEGRYLPL